MKWKIERNRLACLATLALSACGVAEGRTEGDPGLTAPILAPDPAVVTQTPDTAVSSGNAVAVERVKTGRPYTVRGRTYTPADNPDYDEVGYASWYGDELEGKRTANGERFDPAAISAAHTTLPLSSYVEITSLDTGRTILARINDRGPFAEDRLIDMSRGAAQQLGISGHGHAAVRVRRVNPPDQDKALLRAGKQAAERMEAPDALLNGLRQKLNYSPPASPRLEYGVPGKAPSDEEVSAILGNAEAYVVQLAAFSSHSRARGAAQRSGGYLDRRGDIWRLRLGPYETLAQARGGIRLASASGFKGAQIMVSE